MLVIVKLVALLLAILFTLVNTGRFINKTSIPVANILIQAISITIFIIIQFKLGN